MIYLSGAVTPRLVALRRPDLGVMLQPATGNAVPLGRVAWAADNGCFARGDRFDVGAWLAWLARRQRVRSTCLFAVAPDVVGDAAATWRRSAPLLPVIRLLGFRAGYVAQDGFEDQLGSFDWRAADCLFVGGTDAWRRSEAMFRCAREAKRRGLWLHWGRVNSLGRLRAAQAALFDSADGTFVRFAPERNLAAVCAWLDELNRQPALRAA